MLVINTTTDGVRQAAFVRKDGRTMKVDNPKVARRLTAASDSIGRVMDPLRTRIGPLQESVVCDMLLYS